MVWYGSMGMCLMMNACTLNCSCVGKLFSHSLQSFIPIRICAWARDFARNGKIIFQCNCNSLYVCMYACMYVCMYVQQELDNTQSINKCPNSYCTLSMDLKTLYDFMNSFYIIEVPIVIKFILSLIFFKLSDNKEYSSLCLTPMLCQRLPQFLHAQ